MVTNHITRPLTTDDLYDIQKQIELYRHLRNAARAGHYAIHARPGQDEGFLVTNVPAEAHEAIANVLEQKAEKIRRELLEVFNVAIGKDE
jgi:homoserine acetyltransferase